MTTMNLRAPYFRLSLMLAMSGIGSGLSQVAVFGILQSWGATQAIFSLAFVVYVVPGLFSAQLAVRLAERIPLGKVIALFQILGLVGVLLAALGFALHEPFLLIATEFFAALAGGAAFPLLNSAAQRTIGPEGANSVARWEGLMFGSQVVFGTLLGTIVFPIIGAKVFLIIDGLSYICTSVASVTILKALCSAIAPEEKPQNIALQWKELSSKERSAILGLPTLAFIATFGMVSLPFYSRSWTSELAIIAAIAPATLVLASKSIGQFVAPLVARDCIIEWMMQRQSRIYLALTTFVILYIAAASTKNGALGAAAVILAHLASNLVFVTSLSAVQKSFSSELIGSASARTYQLYTGSAVLAAFLAAWISGVVSPVVSISAGLVCCLAFKITSKCYSKILSVKEVRYVE